MTAERAVGGVGRADEAQGVLDTSRAVADDAMTRSDERLRVRTESKPAGRVRLRKQVVTEYQQVTVPVRREEIRLEREPAVDPGPAVTSDSGAPVDTRPPVGAEVADRGRSDDEHVVTLYEERPVVGTETVPVERVRLGKQTVIEQQTVGGQVRREEIELDTAPDVDDPR
jgi:stress response protein YsnF